MTYGNNQELAHLVDKIRVVDRDIDQMKYDLSRGFNHPGAEREVIQNLDAAIRVRNDLAYEIKRLEESLNSYNNNNHGYHNYGHSGNSYDNTIRSSYNNGGGGSYFDSRINGSDTPTRFSQGDHYAGIREPEPTSIHRYREPEPGMLTPKVEVVQPLVPIEGNEFPYITSYNIDMSEEQLGGFFRYVFKDNGLKSLESINQVLSFNNITLDHSLKLPAVVYSHIKALDKAGENILVSVANISNTIDSVVVDESDMETLKEVSLQTIIDNQDNIVYTTLGDYLVEFINNYIKAIAFTDKIAITNFAEDLYDLIEVAPKYFSKDKMDTIYKAVESFIGGEVIKLKNLSSNDETIKVALLEEVYTTAYVEHQNVTIDLVNIEEDTHYYVSDQSHSALFEILSKMKEYPNSTLETIGMGKIVARTAMNRNVTFRVYSNRSGKFTIIKD